MKNGLKLLMAVVIFGIAVLFLSIGIGRIYWTRQITKANLALGTAPYSRTTFNFDDEDFRNLPPPVKRYFEFAWRDRSHLIKRASLRHRGKFLTGAKENQWSDFSSDQVFTANPPGFVWNASMRMFPIVPVAVRDGYSRGMALMQAKVGYVFTVVRLSGTKELAAGELHRFLAEGVWLPTALLPGNGMTWQPLDDTSARATLTDAGISVSLDFFFNSKGEITRAYTSSRYRDVVDGKPALTPWECNYRNYAERNGFMIPFEGEAGWILPEGRSSYFQAEIKGIEFELESL